MEKITVIINFGRSGGTLLNRILGTFPEVVICSEINPLLGATPDHKAIEPQLALKYQMKSWYDIDLEGGSFRESIQHLAQYCHNADKHLVIRDWTNLDFTKKEANGYNPKYSFSIIEELQFIGEIRVFAFVRDAIDVYLSTHGDLQEFASNYLKYVESLIREKIPILKYEDLIRDPQKTIMDICNMVGLAYLDRCKDFTENFQCTGDLQLGKRSRGLRQKEITILPRKWVGWHERKKINTCANLIRANQLLKYNGDYSSQKMESFNQLVIRKIYNRF